MNLFELLAKPDQMVFWSEPRNLTDFLRIQAHFHHAGAAPQVSKIGLILEEAAARIDELYKKEE